MTMTQILNYTQSGIDFTEIYQPVYESNGIMGFDSYTVDQNNNITSQIVPIINCIDIDLCGADMGNNVVLSTFGGLISYIKSLENRINILEQQT